MQGSWDGCYSVVRDYIYIILRMLGRLNVLCGVDVSMRPTSLRRALDAIRGNSEVGIDVLPFMVRAGPP